MCAAMLVVKCLALASPWIAGSGEAAFSSSSSSSSSSSPPSPPALLSAAAAFRSTTTTTTRLGAVTKRQTTILDGAELAYLVATLAAEEAGGESQAGQRPPLPDVAPRSIAKEERVACVSFAVGTIEREEGDDEDDDGAGGAGNDRRGRRAVGVVVAAATGTAPSDAGEFLSMGDGTRVYKDSAAMIPDGVSDADAISTAAAALVGVHCAVPPPCQPSAPESRPRRRTVIVGGGDHAEFLARGHAALGADATLVTARPAWATAWATALGTGGGTGSVDVMSPAVGKLLLGFAAALGEFDSLVDTLGDETGLGRMREIVDGGEDFMKEAAFLGELKRLHGCEKYISTVTRSQQYVLKEGLLFARDHVIRYQTEVEEKFPSSARNSLPPPAGYGQNTLQKLFDAHVIYPAQKNERGPHAVKNSFVRGWSLSDLTELKTWPRDADGAGRYGFPTVDGIASRARRRPERATSEPLSVPAATASASTNVEGRNGNAGSDRAAAAPARKKPPRNPFVVDVDSASHLNNDIVEANRNCVLYVSASYCQTCKGLAPQFTRLARMTTEEHGKDKVTFAKVDIGSGAQGKQLSEILDVEKVPSVLLFQHGQRVGEPMDVKALPSKKLDAAIEALSSGVSLKSLL